VYVEVKNTKWGNLSDASILISNEEISFANFDESDTGVAFSFNVDFII
jgi:hypothetical protein